MGTDGSFENLWRPMPPDEICESEPALAGLEHDRRAGEGREREQGAKCLGLQKLHELTPLNHPRGLEVTNPSQICEIRGGPFRRV
jgi:hypothetical protein